MAEPNPTEGLREPIFGRLFGGVSLLVALGGPIWLLLTAVLHTVAVGRLVQAARESDLVVVVGPGAPEDAPGVLEVAFSWTLLALSGLQALVLTVLLVAVLGLGIFVVRLVAGALDRRLAADAVRRYRAADDGAVLTADAWTRDLPEPDPPRVGAGDDDTPA